MAKALIGHVTSDPRTTEALSRENRRLRTRVADLQDLVLGLQAENDQLRAERSAASRAGMGVEDLQPA